MNFHQMNQPCDCTLKALFNGGLLVTAISDGYYECRNEVTVSNAITTGVFNCMSTYPSSIFYEVNNETRIMVKARYTTKLTSWDFPLCLLINQNGNVYLYVFIPCTYYNKFRFGTWFTISSIYMINL